MSGAGVKDAYLISRVTVFVKTVVYYARKYFKNIGTVTGKNFLNSISMVCLLRKLIQLTGSSSRIDRHAKLDNAAAHAFIAKLVRVSNTEIYSIQNKLCRVTELVRLCISWHAVEQRRYEVGKDEPEKPRGGQHHAAVFLDLCFVGFVN